MGEKVTVHNGLIPEVKDSHDITIENAKESTWSLILKTIATLCLVVLTAAAAFIAFGVMGYFVEKCK